jgi:pyruvate formate lyase activating enzyme
MDPAKHRQFTGTGNEKILSNAIFAADFKKKHSFPETIWIRTPIIPNATDTPENIRGIGEFIRNNLDGMIARWELCAFNNLCRDKYTRLGMEWPYARTALPERSQMEELAQIAKSAVAQDIVCWSGSARLPAHTDQNPAAKQNASAAGC